MPAAVGRAKNLLRRGIRARGGLVLLAVGAAAIALPAMEGVAAAATVGSAGTTLSVTAATGEVNDIRVTDDGVTFTVNNFGSPLTAGPGCTPVDTSTATCVVVGVLQISVDAGDLNDQVRVTGTFPAALLGGPGNDQLFGGTGADTLDGGDGDDALTGGAGTDTFIGGPGSDQVSYVDRLVPIAASLDGVANDGEPGENENIGADVESLAGGQSDDVLVGDDGPNSLIGWDGGDRIDGRGGDDVLRGGAGPSVPSDGDDILLGGDGNDQLAGDAGRDRLDGGAGSDQLFGGPGDDDLSGGADSDLLIGEAGTDTFAGGPGSDQVSYADRVVPVTASLDGLANDGVPGENETIPADVESLAGGDAGDLLIGDDRDNVLVGFGGNDRLYGGGGDDGIAGLDGNDDLDGGPGTDQLEGGPNTDRCVNGEVVLTCEPFDYAVTTSLLAASATVPAGAARVRIADIPADVLPIDATSAFVSIPLRNIDLAASPLRNIPLRNIPLRNIDLPGVPGDPLAQIPLSSLPLGRAGGWETLLAGTPLQGVPLQNLTLQDVYALSPLPEPLQDTSPSPLTLGQIDVAGSPLRNITLLSIVLGATPLRNIPLDWCAALAALGDPAQTCAALGVDLATTPVLALDVAGVPLRNIPLRNIPLRSIDLSASPLRNIPLRNIDLAFSPLRNIPLRNIVLASSPLRNIPLRNIPLRNIDVAPSPLRNIPLRNIAGPDTVVDCARVDCSATGTATLADAAGLVPTAIRDGVTLGSIEPNLDGFGLGDLMAYGDVTLGDVIPGFPADVTLGDAIAALLARSSYPWEDLPLRQIGVQDFAVGGGVADYTTRFQVDGPGQAAPVTVRVELPAGFRYVPGSSTLGPATGSGGAVADPSRSGQTLTYHLDVAPGVPLDLDLRARSSLDLGSFQASATVIPTSGPSPSDTETVQVTQTLEPNDDPATAPILDPDTLYVSHIASSTDRDFYRLRIPVAGARIAVRLSNLSTDHDLVVYRDTRSTQRAVSAEQLPIEDHGVATDGAPLEPETLNDVPLEPLPIVSLSANRSTADETVEAVSPGGGPDEFFTIQVSTYNGQPATEPYVLRVDVILPTTLPPCPARTFPFAGQGVPGALPAVATLPAGLNTVFLVNQDWLADTFGSAAAATVTTRLQALAGRADLGVVGAVLPVEGDATVAAAYQALAANPCAPDTANDVVLGIRGVLDRVRQARPSLRNVVLVGADDVLPMARVADPTRIANEREYASTFFDRNNAYLGSTFSRTVLTDDPYGDVDPVGLLLDPLLAPELAPPELALGRLVETPAEIVAQVDRFTTAGGAVDPRTALATGYDFLADGAARTRDAFTSQLGAANVQSLISESWTRQNLIDLLFPAAGVSPGLIALNGHADHRRLLPAAGNTAGDESDVFTTADVLARPGRLNGRVLFSVGCHTGLSVSDVIIGATDDRAPDWAQTLTAQAAAFAGNSGFGYGDTDVVAYSERLMELFARRLDRTVTVGQALMFAKQAYAAEHQAPAFASVYDQKVLAEAVLYGLPMFRLGAPVAPPPPPPPLPRADDPVTGLESASFAVTPAFSRVDGPRGSYYTVGGATQVAHYRPIQPRVELDVTQPDVIAHGALVTGLASTDTPGFDPVFARPSIDLAAHEPEVVPGDAIFPSKLQAISTYQAPSGQRQALQLVPAQFFGDGTPDANGAGVERLFTSLRGLVYYSTSTDFEPPSLRRVDAALVNASAGFAVEAEDRLSTGGAGSVERVFVLLRDAAGTWRSVDLEQTAGTTRWTGGIPVTGSRADYCVQAVDSAGNVGVSCDKGSYFQALAPPPVPGTLTATRSGPLGLGGWYVGPVSLTVASATGSRLEASVDGGPFTVVTSPLELAADGVHLIQVRAADGTRASLVVPIDRTRPSISIDSPADGMRVALGEPLTAGYLCTDAGSGLTACAGSVADGAPIDTTVAGTRSFTVTARDAAGNTASRTTTYAVVPQCRATPPAGAILGTSGPNVLNGTAGDDVIYGLGGDDRIDGRGGSDTICGGAGNDYLIGGAGNDVLDGGQGQDTIEGNADNDVIHGGPDADRLLGSDGADTMDGGLGADDIDGGIGDDKLDGGRGRDRLRGGGGNDLLLGAEGRDDLGGEAGDDTLRGGRGSDDLDGGPGTDLVDGGTGNDRCRAGETVVSCERPW